MRHYALITAGLLLLGVVIVGAYFGVTWLAVALHPDAAAPAMTDSYGLVAHQFAQAVHTMAAVHQLPRVLHVTVPADGRPAACTVQEVGHRGVLTLAGTHDSFPAVCQMTPRGAYWNGLPQ